MMKRNKTCVYAEINICWKAKKKEAGELDVGYINEQLNVSKGRVEIFSRKTKKKYMNRWVWSTKKYKTLYVEKVLEEVLERFGDRSDILQNIKKELNANIALEIVIEMKKNQIPALVIDEKIIKFVRDIGGYIDVDMYII